MGAIRWADMTDSDDESEVGVSSGKQIRKAGSTAMVSVAERRVLWSDLVDSDDESEVRVSTAAVVDCKVGDCLPEASEEVWQRRERKRQDAVAMVKALDAYRRLESCRRPRSPDPFDRSISKRKWETTVAAWKSELRSWSEHE